MPRGLLSRSPFFGEGTEEDADQVWDQLNTDAGILALDHSYAADMGLPRSQDFPWDPSKGIYLLSGYHAMHCVVSFYFANIYFFLSELTRTTNKKYIRSWVRQVDQGLPTTRSAEHILHCVDALRQAVECYADDTLLYTGNQERGKSRTGHYVYHVIDLPSITD